MSRWRRPGSIVRDLAVKAEQIVFDLTLIAELNLNDIKGVDADSLDAWVDDGCAGRGDEEAGTDGGSAAYVS